VDGAGPLANILLGVIGAVVGGLLLPPELVPVSPQGDIVASTIGAVSLLFCFCSAAWFRRWCSLA
jgi:uncharacterized membrane protein YeaQ/YmgE (transglycosylase-associated protein family)